MTWAFNECSFLFVDFAKAADQVREHRGGVDTPLREKLLNNIPDHIRAFFKDETSSPLRSFKFRGVYNHLLANQNSIQNGVIASSSGNHGMNVANMAKQFGVPAVIVVPKTATKSKIEKIEALGARVLVRGETLIETYRYTDKLAEKLGYHKVPTNFSLPLVAGHASIVAEIVRQHPQVDVIVGPVGGGALMLGVSQFIKQMGLDIVTVGVQPSNVAPLAKAIETNGQMKKVPVLETQADALKTYEVLEGMFELYKDNVQMITVTEAQISRARRELSEQGIVAEGAGATATAAIYKSDFLKTLAEEKGRPLNVVFLVTGGN